MWKNSFCRMTIDIIHHNIFCFLICTPYIILVLFTTFTICYLNFCINSPYECFMIFTCPAYSVLVFVYVNNMKSRFLVYVHHTHLYFSIAMHEWFPSPLLLCKNSIPLRWCFEPLQLVWGFNQGNRIFSPQKWADKLS